MEFKRSVKFLPLDIAMVILERQTFYAINVVGEDPDSSYKNRFVRTLSPDDLVELPAAPVSGL